MNLLAILATQSENSITRAISGPIDRWSLTFLAPETGFVEDNFSQIGGGKWFGDDSSTLHLLCTSCLLLLHQFYLRSAGIRPWRLGATAIDCIFQDPGREHGSPQIFQMKRLE